jgi:hypothetical protein
VCYYSTEITGPKPLNKAFYLYNTFMSAVAAFVLEGPRMGVVKIYISSSQVLLITEAGERGPADVDKNSIVKTHRNLSICST